MHQAEVVIVGAGPSGLATAACLSRLSIACVVLEREHCSASLWKLRAYDRLKLHLGKQFCNLPHMPFPDDAPTFVPKDQFIEYLDRYVDHFGISPVYSTVVELASYDQGRGVWRVVTRNVVTQETEEYTSRFLVVATGENASGHIPGIPGLDTFPGRIVHSAFFKSGKEYAGKSVLVVGSGNSGMEIAYDLADHGARSSIVIHGQMHVMTKEMIYLGMILLNYHFPVVLVDSLVLFLAWLVYGDLHEYGIVKPSIGPFALKAATGRSAVIDVGTVAKIKTGEIKVIKGIRNIRGNEVESSDGTTHHYDAMVFATGFRSTAKNWLRDGDSLLDKDGFPKEQFPNHWKGGKDLYCVGFARRGLAGVSMDAQNVAKDIYNSYHRKKAESI